MVISALRPCLCVSRYALFGNLSSDTVSDEKRTSAASAGLGTAGFWSRNRVLFDTVSFRNKYDIMNTGSYTPNSPWISPSARIRSLGREAFFSISSTLLAIATSIKRPISIPRKVKNRDGSSSNLAPTP